MGGSLNKTQKDQLICTYAALLLHDGELEISEAKLAQVIKSSGNEVEGYWPGLYAMALKGADIGALLTNVGTAAPAGGAAAPAAGGGAGDGKKKEDDKKEEEEEEDIDMGDMFGGDDDY